jgi:hypothetical protein
MALFSMYFRLVEVILINNILVCRVIPIIWNKQERREYVRIFYGALALIRVLVLTIILTSDTTYILCITKTMD